MYELEQDTSSQNKSCRRVKNVLFMVASFGVMLLLTGGLLLFDFLYRNSSAEEKGSSNNSLARTMTTGGYGMGSSDFTKDYISTPGPSDEPDLTKCRKTMRGAEYRGHINVTKDGVACQHWNSQHPHSHNQDLTRDFPDDSLDAAGNYCRNPDYSDGPWCYHAIYTLSDNRYGNCDVPMCPGYPSR